MSLKRIGRLLLPSIFILLMLPTFGVTSTSGKISGEVIDAETGNPIEGATVRINGTSHATMTDLDGEFYIINMPSGKYNVVISFVGYESIIKKDVRVLADLTSPVDFVLRKTAIELETQIVVSAANPIIQKDLTASRITFTAEQLRLLPNIVTIQSVLQNYPGVITDANNGLHVRGGRAGQISYYYDGLSVQDPFNNTIGIRIMPSALEELSLTSGGFTAEYGEALSGVVNAVTREGGSEYHGGMRLYEGLTHQYDVLVGDWKDLNFFSNRSGSFHLSGPMPNLDPKRNTFFVAGEYLRDPSYLPTNWNISYTGTAKLALRPISTMKVVGTFSYNKANGRQFDHRDQNGISYDLNLDGLPAFETEAYIAGLSGSYNFSEGMVLSAALNRFSSHQLVAPAHLMDTYWDQWPGYSEDTNGIYNGTIHEDNYLGSWDLTDPRQTAFFTVDDDFAPEYQLKNTEYNSAKASLVNQISKIHQLKGGLEYRKYSIEWDDKKFYNDNPYGEKYASGPTYASAYLQDKMEYDYFIINLGTRLDYANADIAYNITPRSKIEPDENAPDVWVSATSKTRISPRLGVSFPISEKSMMHFNYGIYYQQPSYIDMYINLKGDISSGFPLLGNPDLKPERTTSYELGLDHLIGEDLRVDVTAYYKDVSDLVTTRSFFKEAGNVVTQFTNDDYGSVKGFDIAIQKLPIGSYFSGAVSYSYMISSGNGSFAWEPYYTFLTSNEDTLAPITEYPLDFDQRHTVTGVVSYQVPRNQNIEFAGMRIPGAWAWSFVGHYGSGLPYTATDVRGNRLGERNENRLPANYTVDMRFNKDLYLFGNDEFMSFFIEVDNIFDERNVLSVYNRTGSPEDDGQLIGGSLSASQDLVDFYDRLSDHDPQNFSKPRTIRTGLEFNF